VNISQAGRYREGGRTGLYAIASLDESISPPEDLLTLGLATGGARSDSGDFSARVLDAEQVNAADSAWQEDDCCCFLGELEDLPGLAATLDCGIAPAQVALAAMRRWGPQILDNLKGEWSLLYWCGSEKTLWLGASPVMRDRHYFAFDGRRVAISGDIRRLGAVSWVGATFDPEGVAFALGREKVRRLRNGRTVLKHVLQVETGTLHRFTPDGRHATFQASPYAMTPWRGDFEAAVTAVEQRLRQRVRAMLSHHERVAVLLSGGLDSTLLARFVAEQAGPSQKVICLTAVAPPGSQRPDEREKAAMVAEAFGLEHRLVYADEDARVFRPSRDNHLDNGPSLSPRHYLFDALFDAARAFGATGVFHGVGGEISVSRTEVLATVDSRLTALIAWARAQRRFWRDRRSRIGAYHAALAPTLSSALSEDYTGLSYRELHTWPRPARSPMGMLPFYWKAWAKPTSVAGGGLRLLMPFRDPWLVRLIAGMPAEYAARNGQDRALVRALLKGRAPDHIRLQSKGLPFSVDYSDRLREEAHLILDYIPAWREAGAGEWLDLDWLERQAALLSAGKLKRPVEQFQIQLTALAAEYFLDWRQPGN
jgi:asparagine synthase (glutamine-hydrolysing)